MSVPSAWSAGGIVGPACSAGTTCRILNRSLGYGAALGATFGTLIGLAYYIVGAFLGFPIGLIYGGTVGLLNAPALVAVRHRGGTRQASRIAAAVTSGCAGAVTSLVLLRNAHAAELVLTTLAITALWSAIGWAVGPRVAFGKQPKTADSALT
jgi:hypothetical protein